MSSSVPSGDLGWIRDLLLQAVCTKGTESDGSSARDRSQSPEHGCIDLFSQILDLNVSLSRVSLIRWTGTFGASSRVQPRGPHGPASRTSLFSLPLADPKT